MLEARRVIWQILCIYLITSGIFLVIFFILWYEKLYAELVNENTRLLRDTHRTIVLSVTNSKYTPINEACKNISAISNTKFAILDEKQIICSTLDFDIKGVNVSIRQSGIYNNHAFYMSAMDWGKYYLSKTKDKTHNQEFIEDGSLRTFIQGKDLSKELFAIRLYLLMAIIASFVIIGIIGYFLTKIALRPLDEKIRTLNSFIKDFTHEINTPLSIILLSIEQIEASQNEITPSKLTRMKIAARTLSQTYSDLIFYSFPDTIDSSEEELDIKALLNERLEYFKLFFEQKKLSLRTDLAPCKLFASKSKINKMLDNILSNAVKYNKKNGFIEVELKQGFLRIKDSGCGIEPKNLKAIFSRYARFNKDQGGFGIGLALVQGICKEYNIEISCNSTLGEGSEFILQW